VDQLAQRFWEIFFDVFGALPRQGPGNRASLERALRLCGDLPPSPAVLDLGCGVGGQTLALAERTSGPIVAIDSHAPWIHQLTRTVAERGLSERVRPMIGDMARPTFEPGSFDLIWSEGALYNIGIDRALSLYRPLLRAGGHFVFSDAVWRKDNPPAEVKASFDFDYPTMGWAADILATIQRRGLDVIGHFTLPDEAWWDDFYSPMERRLAELRVRHAGDGEALAVLDQIAREPELHRRYSDYYAYELFVVRRAR
jgi:SAM-dependent methyltransferase